MSREEERGHKVDVCDEGRKERRGTEGNAIQVKVQSSKTRSSQARAVGVA
jgi:hypothetical protein